MLSGTGNDDQSNQIKIGLDICTSLACLETGKN